MPESPDSFSTKFAQQRHWPLGIFVALLGVIVKKCGPKILAIFSLPADPAADSLAGTLHLATSISGTLLCLLGLFIIARGVIKLHATDDPEATEK